MTRRPLFIVLVAVALVGALWSYMLLNASTHRTLDQRVQDVASQLKCPICQSESVADSPSGLAQQMRSVIRQQLQQGKSEQEIIQYFVSSYGEGIVWSPPWQGFSLLAWLVPIGLLVGGGILLFFIFRDWRMAKPLNRIDDEEAESHPVADADLERYRGQLERELASEDPLFKRYGTEAN
jgi:cytochrome c-type biogenesis protein CcmH